MTRNGVPDNSWMKFPWYERITSGVMLIIMCTFAVFANLFNLFRCLVSEEAAANVLAIISIVFSGLWLIAFIAWLILYLKNR